MPGWRGGGALGWLARLLRQDQLVGPRDAQPVFLLPMLDDDLASGSEEMLGANDRPPGRGLGGPCGLGRAHTRLACAGSITSPLRCVPRRDRPGKNSGLPPAGESA